MKAFIGASRKEIALSELVVVPSFLRFGQVKLEYRDGSQSIAQKCDSFLGYLLSIKASVYDSNRIYFSCAINDKYNNRTQFRNDSALVEHIRAIVSICDSSREYSFLIRPFIDTDFNITSDLIASILEMPAIARNSYVHIFLDKHTFLPIKIISNWLDRERNVMGQNQRERKFTLICRSFRDAQIHKIYEFMKQVSFIFKYLSSTYFL